MNANTARHRWFAALLLLGLGAYAPLMAQPDPEFVTITFQPEGLGLDEAIRMATEGSGRPFLFGQDRTLSQKKIFMTGEHRVDRTRLFEFWQTVFFTQGYAIIPMGPKGNEVWFVEGVDNSRIIKQTARYVDVGELEELQRRAGEVIMTSIPFRYVEVGSVRQAVGQILQTRQAEFTQEVASANSLIVVGFAPTVYAIYQLAKAMDVESKAVTLKFEKLELQFAVAEELQPIISDLIQTQSGGAPGQPAVRRAGENVLPGQEKPSPKLIADPRTNSLVVYAVDSDLSEIKKLVGFLDTPVTEVESNIRVYYLKNTNADDISERLRELFGQTASRTQSGTGIRGAQGQQAQTTIQSGQEVIIVPDGNTNSLLISCTRTKYEEIEKLIEELDRRRPQVLVQAAVAELSDSDIFNAAVELTAVQGGDDEYKGAFGTGFGLSAIQGTSTTPSSLFDGIVRVPFAAASGISFSGLAAGIIQNDLNVPILVNLLKTTTKGNLVSVPSVLTNDNEQSTIRVGRQVPTSSLNTNNIGTTETFGGYEEANLSLTISPHISSDGYIRMEVELLVDAFVGAVDIIDGIPPPKTTREFVGSVTVPNGKTVVIGGLVQDNYTESVSKVPLLGDIPILGHLFRTTAETKEKTTLYLFITPTIFSTFTELERVSYQRKLEVEKLAGNVKLFDPNFRAVDLDDPNVKLEDVYQSGALDLPRFAPINAEGGRPAVDGIPAEPTTRPGEDRAVVPPGGTRTFISGGGEKK